MASSSGVETTFWKRRSTWIVTAIRLLAILLSHTRGIQSSLLPTWWYSDSLTCILVKPTFSIFHLREALAIQRFSGGKLVHAYTSAYPRIQAPPLLLVALTPIVKSEHAGTIMAFLMLLVDLAIAGMIESVGNIVLFTNRVEDVDKESEQQKKLPASIQAPNRHVFAIDKRSLVTKDNPLICMESLPLLAAQFYFWSPFTILSSSVYSCFQSLPAFFHLLCWNEAVNVNCSFFLSTFFLALAACLEIHHVVYLIPLVALPIFQGRRLAILASFAFWYSCLQGLSYQLVGNSLWLVIQSAYGMGWRTIKPSLSVQWYLAIQLFSRFRGYFGTLLLGIPYILVAPVSIRLARHPIVVVAIFSMVWTIFRPVETLWDANMALTFFLLCPRSLARMGKAAFVAICSIGVPISLTVLDHWLWVGPNTGNANFMFFQCLAFNVFLSILLVHICKGSLERDKAIRLIAQQQS